ncbi:Glycosyltransferase involved in cell wall bisynthesis [Orenia metallireducens]|uniref:Glycosyltransferase involved in cell wall bisynthesis n=1 Tax=Orenia metallireducens TaxID=1413210 RepID=A0A285FW17_9FIRM|nr:glycosyltransferase family 4 protein [Orenia metallireducens]SNY15313.1 Glycosyltransferase involved in cell wall bisynthesis [Orenia metallireducens]
MKKVLIISHEFPPETGGAGSYAFDIANGLGKKEQFDITVVTKKNKYRSLKNINFSIKSIKTYPKIGFWNLWREVNKLNLEEYNRIILNDIGAGQVGAFFLNDAIKEKAVCVLHGSEPEVIYGGKNKILKLINYSALYTKLLKKCFGIIAVSEDMKKKFIEFSNLTSIEKRIFVIRNGIDVNQFCPSKVDLYNRYKIPKNNKLILTVSRITKLKGYDNKLSILEKLRDRFPHFTWIIVGDGDYLNDFKEKVRESSLSNQVIFVGKIRRDLLKEYYSSVDLFFLLSEYRESFGLVYLEANACGCPVIGNKYGGVKEVIINGVNGYCVNNLNHQFIIEMLFNILNKKIFDKDVILKYAYENKIDNTLQEIANKLEL